MSNGFPGIGLLRAAWSGRALITGLAVLAAAALIGCGGGGGDSAGPLPLEPAKSGSARIGAAGGEVQAVLEGGTQVRLEVPPDALAQATVLRIDPEPAPPGTQGRFRIAPAGLVLRKPLTLTVTLPAGAGTPDADLTLMLVTGDQRVPASGRPDPATRTLTALLHHLGAVSDGAGIAAAGRQRALARTGPRPRADEPEDPAVVAELVRASYQEQIDTLTRVVTTLTQQQGSRDNAIAAQAAFESILHWAGADIDARVGSLAESWRSFVCAQRSFAVSELNRYDGVAVNVIERLVRDALIWGQLATLMGGPLGQLVPPLAGCADAPSDFTEPVNARMPAMLANVERALALLDPLRDFDQLLEARMPELYRLESVLQHYGVQASALDLIATQASRLRAGAFQACRGEQVTGRPQEPQARLLTREAGGDPTFAAASPYGEAELRSDIQLCGMRYRYGLFDPRGAVIDERAIGGVSFSERRTELTMELGGVEELGLESIGARRLSCPSGAVNDERLVISAGPAGGALSVIRTLEPAGAEYPSVRIPMSELRPRLQTDGSLAGGQIVLQREGGLCNGEFANLVQHERLVRLLVAEAAPLEVALRVDGPLRGPTPLSVAVLDSARREPVPQAQVRLIVDGGMASGGTTDAGGNLTTTLRPSFEKPVVTVRAEVSAQNGGRGTATVSVGTALPLSWSGTVAVDQVETMSYRYAEPGDGANFFGSERTGSREGNLSVTLNVEVDLDRFGQRRALRILGATGGGSLKTAEHSETDFLGEPGTVSECRVIAYRGGSVDLPSTTQVSGAGLGLQLNSDRSYQLDLGGSGSAVLASGPASVRSYSYYRKAPSETRECAFWLVGGIDGTTTAHRSTGVLGLDAPAMSSAIANGEIAGTATRVIDLAWPEQGQSGSRTITVTWSLRPK